MPIDYSKAKIYKLTTIHNPDLVYYGSTVNELYKRKGNHKSKFKIKDKNICSSSQLFELGIDDVEITLVEMFSCNSKEELLKRERFYIQNNNCVNKNIPSRTLKEYYKDNKDIFKKKFKKYNEENKDKIKEINKEYRENNKDNISLNKKKYYEENKDKIKDKIKEYQKNNKDKKKQYYKENKDNITLKKKEYMKEYYEQNKEKIKEKTKQYKDKIKKK